MTTSAAADASSWLLADLVNTDPGKVRAALLSRGLDQDAGEAVQRMLQQAAQRLIKQAGAGAVTLQSEVKAFWVPGRIEVAGKHTDYAGGRSLLAAVNRGFAVVAVPREDAKLAVYTQFADGREDQQEMRMTADMSQLSHFQSLPLDKGGWATYPAAAVQRLVANFGISRGAHISMECNLPEASGLSSSSAVICYMWMVLDSLNAISSSNTEFQRCIHSPAELYTYLGNIENGKHFKPGSPQQLDGAGGVGTFGGSEDHTAIMSCGKGSLGLWQFCPTEHLATVHVDPGIVFVVAVSGAKAEKTGGAKSSYNDAALLAQWAAGSLASAVSQQSSHAAPGSLTEEALADLFQRTGLYNPKSPNLAEVVRKLRSHLGDSELEGLRTKALAAMDDVGATFKQLLQESSKSLGWNVEGLDAEQVTLETLKTRFVQFFNESESIVPGMALAFAVRDYATLGKLADQSHEATVLELQNTVPETAWLPRWARSAEGAGQDKKSGGMALAASAFGAGFGGSCWALVESSRAEAFREAWRDAYERQFPVEADRGEGVTMPREFFITQPSPGAFAL